MIRTEKEILSLYEFADFLNSASLFNQDYLKGIKEGLRFALGSNIQLNVVKKELENKKNE
jgi:hypothetical protein